MVILKKNFIDLIVEPIPVSLLLYVGFTMKEQNQTCIINPSDLPSLSKPQYNYAIERLKELDIIEATIAESGTKISLLPNSYILISDALHPKQKKRVDVSSVEPVIVSQQYSQQSPQKIIEIGALLGVGNFETNIDKPEYIDIGIPSHLLGTLTETDKTEYFGALKTKINDADDYLRQLAFQCSVDLSVIKEEWDKYSVKIWETKKYVSGMRSVKPIFKNHCIKVFVKKEVEVEESGIFRQFSDAYYRFHTEILGNPKPPFGSREGKSIKTLVAYFTNASKGDEIRAVEAFNVMFDNWYTLNPFYKKWVSINQISTHIVEIINEFRNGKQNSKDEKYDNLKRELGIK